jgi:hypothetical protein
MAMSSINLYRKGVAWVEPATTTKLVVLLIPTSKKN